MSYRKDIKDGKVRYKYRYREFDPSKNKMVQRETTWCKTQREAYRAYLDHIEGKELKKAKITLDMALKEYLEILESKSKRITSDKKSSDYTYFQNCRALYRYYFYPSIRFLDMSEVQPRHFAQWLEYINSDTMEHKPLKASRISALRTQLSQFSSWLVLKGYIFEGFDISVSSLMAKVNVKKRKNSKRTDRNQPKFTDIWLMCDYYRSTFYKFESCYWFTLFKVLFFTGMRVCELVALKWCNVDFDADHCFGVIKIRDSISEKEKREDVKRRHASGNLLTKNSMSVRNITMFYYYRDYLKHYAFRYSLYYGVSFEEMSDMYVFPNITSRDDKKEYQDHGNILYQVNKVCSKCNLPKFDPQMFRHGFTYYLACTKHLPIDQAYRLLGHTDSDMIKEVYLNMDVEETRDFVDKNLKSLITVDCCYLEPYEEEEEYELSEAGDRPLHQDEVEIIDDQLIYYSHAIEESIKDGTKHVLVQFEFLGNIKKFLKDKYDLSSITFEEVEIS